MVVAQLVKQFLLTPEISCANPVIGNILVKKWAIRGLFFFYFRLFYKQLTVNMFNGLNRVRVHRYRKRPLCQLRHDHCPSTTTYCFFKKNWAIPGLFFVIFVFQYTVDSKQMFNINVNFCRWLDSICGPLVSEATALPTEPQPLPECTIVTQGNICVEICLKFHLVQHP